MIRPLRLFSISLWYLAPFLLALSISFTTLPNLWAQPEKEALGISAQLDRLIKELESIEQKQQEILSEQDKTVEKIKNLKIWARG